MNDVLRQEISTICCVHMVAIVLALVFIMIFYTKARRDYALNAFFVMQVSMIGWMMFKIFKTVAPTVYSRWWFIVGYYFCACVFEVAFLEFGFAYYKRRPLKTAIRLVAYGCAAIQFLVVATNPIHHLFYRTYDFWGDSFGPLFYVHTALVYSFIFAGFVYGGLTFEKRFRGEALWYKFLIACAIVVPVILNFLFITKVLHRWLFSIGVYVVFDITPIVFVFSTLVFIYATFKHNFIDQSPIMRHEIVQKLDTALCLMNYTFQPIYFNSKFEQLVESDTNTVLTQAIEAKGHRVENNQVFELEIGEDVFRCTIKSIETLKERQYLLVVNRVTDYRNAAKTLMLEQECIHSANRVLRETIDQLKVASKMSARNFVARELHDIIGHSLVVTIKLLEVADIYLLKNVKLSQDALNDAVLSLENGVQMMTNIVQDKYDYTGNALEVEIKKCLFRLKGTGIQTHFNFKGRQFQLSVQKYDIVSKVSMELVTNALKHANAKELFLSVVIGEKVIEVLVMDNGVGCEQLVLGNGLKGINDRVLLVGGEMTCMTNTDEGFVCKVTIPGLNDTPVHNQYDN